MASRDLQNPLLPKCFHPQLRYPSEICKLIKPPMDCRGENKDAKTHGAEPVPASGGDVLALHPGGW